MAHTFIRQAEEKHGSRLRHLESTYGIFPDLVEEMGGKAQTVISYFRDKTG